MGTFMGYKGRMAVPDDKRELFTEQMMKVFYYGGMMSFDDVKLYGHALPGEKDVWKGSAFPLQLLSGRCLGDGGV